jgi:hypothetical protein
LIAWSGRVGAGLAALAVIRLAVVRLAVVWRWFVWRSFVWRSFVWRSFSGCRRRLRSPDLAQRSGIGSAVRSGGIVPAGRN